MKALVLNRGETADATADALLAEFQASDEAGVCLVVADPLREAAEILFATRSEDGPQLFRFSLTAAQCGEIALALEQAEQALLSARLLRARAAAKAGFAC